jgi:hypothetical protein
MSERPYFNEATMQQKVEALRNDQAQHSTYHQRAIAEAGLELGRFSHLSKEQIVTGSRSVPQYPRQHGTPWSKPDPSGQEPSLGYSVDAMDPIGGPPERLEGSASLPEPQLPSAEVERGADPSLFSRSLRGKI